LFYYPSILSIPIYPALSTPFPSSSLNALLSLSPYLPNEEALLVLLESGKSSLLRA
jgi:hypothetical protein